MQGTALTDVVSFRPEHVSRLLNYGIQNDLIPHLAERDLAEHGPAISKAGTKGFATGRHAPGVEPPRGHCTG